MSTRLFGRIDSPCEVNWESLEGEGAVRYCVQCKLNVHNFAEMTANEVAEVMGNSEGRLCARIRPRPDGSLYTDNCPYRLRRIRDRIRRVAPWAFVFLAFLFHQSIADAQGLIGAGPEAGRLGLSGEVGGGLTDYDYDTARDLSRVVTALSAAMGVLILSVRSIRDGQTIALLRNKTGDCRLGTKDIVRRRMIQLLCILLAPVVIHLIGTFAINNLGCYDLL